MPHAISAEAEPPLRCMHDDLECMAAQRINAVVARCPSFIEQGSRYKFRWLEATPAKRFSHVRWTREPGGDITYIGDQIEYQNAFGTYVQMTYECDLSIESLKLVDVRAREGRLPR